MSKFIVIADDFTGANDTGMQFFNQGCSVSVSLDKTHTETQSDITVYNTDSRSMPPDMAKQVITSVTTHCAIDNATFIYKKIDATFRGNIGAEIDALLGSTPFHFAVLCSALPDKQRTVEKGKCLYRGQGVIRSEFATDPKTPVVSDSIAEIIACQSALPVQCVDAAGLAAAICQARAHPDDKVIIVVDAATNDDLARIGNTLAATLDGGILIGSSGLAAHLPAGMYLKKPDYPSLVVAGSISPVTINQIARAAEEGVATVYFVDIREIMTNLDYMDQCVTDILGILNKGENCIIQSSKSAAERFNIDANCKLYEMSRAEFADYISGFLGNLASSIIHRCQLSGVLFTGGDIAISCAAALGSKSYTIKGEILPCIPVGYLDGVGRVFIATKAGSHGDDDAIVNVIEFFRKEYHR